MQVSGLVGVVQDDRLTCLSVFELSIRAQTLAMRPLTPVAVWGTCQQSEVISVSWTHISERGLTFHHTSNLSRCFSLCFFHPRWEYGRALSSLLTLQTFRGSSSFLLIIFACFHLTPALFQQAIIFCSRAASISLRGTLDVLLDLARLQLVSNESQHPYTRNWRVFLSCSLISMSHGIANGFYFQHTMQLQSCWDFFFNISTGKRGLQMQHMISTWGCCNSEIISRKGNKARRGRENQEPERKERLRGGRRGKQWGKERGSDWLERREV